MVRHNFTYEEWGHALTAYKKLPDGKYLIAGFGPKVNGVFQPILAGDAMFRVEGQEIWTFDIEKVDYFDEPVDMFVALAVATRSSTGAYS